MHTGTACSTGMAGGVTGTGTGYQGAGMLCMCYLLRILPAVGELLCAITTGTRERNDIEQGPEMGNDMCVACSHRN